MIGEDQFVTQFGDYTIGQAFVFLMAIIFIGYIVYKIYCACINIYKMSENRDKRFDAIEEQLKEMKKLVEHTAANYEMNKCTMSYILNTQIKHFYKIGYIPGNEYAEFVDSGKIAESAKINHGLQGKIEKCIEDLDVKY